MIKPMGLHDTTFHPTAAMGPRLAEGHDAALKPIPPLGIFNAAGGLRSTPQDLAHFAAAILPGSGARIAPDELLAVRRPAPWIGGMQALGWEVLDAPGGTLPHSKRCSPRCSAYALESPSKARKPRPSQHCASSCAISNAAISM